MDLMFSHFVTSDEPKEEKKKHKSSKSVENSAGFSLVFNKSQPVKAVVAKKRVAPVEQNTLSKQKFSLKPTVQLEDNGQKQDPQTIDSPSSTSTSISPSKKRKKEKIQSSLNSHDAPRDKPKKSKPQPDKIDDNTGSPSGGKFLLTEKFNQLKQARKSNIFDRLKNQMPKLELPEVHPLTEKVFSDSSIDSLDIHPHTKKNIADLLGYKQLTVVQSLSIPKLLAGSDALIRAQTGSGKTLAYALPLVEKLQAQQPRVSRTDGILAVVVVPTRELALQTYELFLKLLKPFTWIVSGYLCGGEKRKAEKARLRAGLNILIGTPGRFCDHIKNTECMKLSTVKYLILDEADRLLELGYEKDVKQIVESIKEARSDDEIQTVLLSATLTSSVKQLAGLTLKNPAYVDTSDIAVDQQLDNINVEDIEERITIPATVRQAYIMIPPKLRLVTLSGLIAYEQSRGASKVLIFMATQGLIDFHYDTMVEVLTHKKPDSDAEDSAGENESSESEADEVEDSSGESILMPNVSFFKLHGKMTQIERSSVFKEFRKAKSAVLLCTDVAARGIDVPSVDLVVQYHAPQILADYVHRVGRTARAGLKGKAVLFVEPAESEFIKYLASKQIKLAEEKVDPMFGKLGQMLNCTVRRKGKNKEQAVIELQHRYERLVTSEKELFDSACKAFVSWVRYYSNFPKELRRIFAIKAVNMGHYAKCLGLRDPPKQFVRQHTAPNEADRQHGGRRQEDQRGPRRQHQPRAAGGDGKRKRPIGGSSNNGDSHAGMPARFNSNPNRFQPGTGKHQSQHKDGSKPFQDLASYAKHSRMINTSEFDSGLAPVGKKSRKQ